MTKDILRKIAEIHKALSAPMRLAIMQILYGKDQNVNNIIEIIREEYQVKNMDRTNISKHLTLLKSLGIISCISQGQKRLYHLEARCLMGAISCTLDAVMQG